MSGRDDAEDYRPQFKAPYTPRHQIPTIQKYREEKAARKAEAASDGFGSDEDTDLSKTRTQRAKDAWSTYKRGDAQEDGKADASDEQQQQQAGIQEEDEDDDGDDEEDSAAAVDTSEANPVAQNPKKRRKGLMGKDERAERQVTDPVTHLPVTIQDFTSDALKKVDENEPSFGKTPRTATGLSNKNKSSKELHEEIRDLEKSRESMEALFPPPSFDVLRQDLIEINRFGMTIGLLGIVGITVLILGIERALRYGSVSLHLDQGKVVWLLEPGLWLIAGLIGAGAVWALIVGLRDWMSNRIDDVWSEQVWEANRKSRIRDAKAHETESVLWLNSLLASVWPLINPDLFTSLADTLEDVMQASLPSMVQMVSVEDIGQGSEALRILGVRWLPSGAAGRSVGSDGKLESKKAAKNHSNDRIVQGEGEVEDTGEGNNNQDDESNDNDDKKKRKKKSDDGAEKAAIAEGMEAEEGDFINLEVAFAYRARAAKSLKERTKDMHLYIAFWLPGKLKIPIWVDTRGVIGTVRLRLQLAPDPPFFALCTLTFLGQPKVDISCIPLVKHGLNIMDLPLISNFVQSSVDAAMSQYVAPKSLTLDLKSMLAGDDFKKDTNARGVLMVHIKRGYDFKMGDAAIPLISDGKSDPYVSIGWAKFGKPMWSTRVLISEMEPVWDERAFLLITPEELNVQERLRVQLWDSDRFTTDDDLGRIELDVQQLMKDEATNGKMCDRTDGFRALKAGENMPGKLEWSVGYFSKTRLQACQFEKQTYDTSIRSMEQLEKKVDEVCQQKLREASIKKGRHSRDAQELKQQKAQEMKMMQDAMTISAPPPDDYPSGIFSLQIHQITGLELETMNKTVVDKKETANDEEEDGEDLPSAYCTIIINHNKAFKTRTKPKNAKPFYNAGTERFIPDWHNAEIYISVRDARTDENDPLLGIVHLPLGDVFRERSQVDGYYPLQGGLGYGRMRISMVWRSIQLQVPRQYLGWDYGTLEIKSGISSADVSDELQSLKLKFHSNLSSAKMYANRREHKWRSTNDKSLKLAVYKRYSSCLAIRLKRHGVIKDQTAAFAILWLKDIPDEEPQDLTLPVWEGDYERAIANSLDDYGKKVGSVKLNVTFWSGLGGAHSKWASKDPNLRNVLEVLEVARDNYESKRTEQAAGIVDADESSSSSDNSSDDEQDNKHPKHDDDTRSGAHPDSDAKAEGKFNVIDKAKDYKKHAGQKHRRNRGVMQYKIPRTANWAMHKVGRAEDKLSGIFKRHTREPEIETEV